MSGATGAAAGSAAASGATIAAFLLGGGSQPMIALVLLVGVAVVVGALTTVAGAFGAAAVCWACYDGFVLNRFGELGFTAADLRAFALLVAVAVAASAAEVIVRRGRPGSASSR